MHFLDCAILIYGDQLLVVVRPLERVTPPLNGTVNAALVSIQALAYGALTEIYRERVFVSVLNGIVSLLWTTRVEKTQLKGRNQFVRNRHFPMRRRPLRTFKGTLFMDTNSLLRCNTSLTQSTNIEYIVNIRFDGKTEHNSINRFEEVKDSDWEKEVKYMRIIENVLKID
jgi:hypothetical protein